MARAERQRDEALKAVGELSSRTDSLEQQVAKLGELLQESRQRTSEKAKQLQDAEVGNRLAEFRQGFVHRQSPRR